MANKQNLKTETVPSKKSGTKPEEERKTYIVKSNMAEKVDAIAYWDRVNIKDVVNEALADLISKYEKKNGPIKPVPKK